MKVTNHAKERIRQRLGANKRAIESLSAKALLRGLKHKDTSGSLHKYISSLYFKNRSANNIRIYGEQVFIFANETLITVFHLPNKFKKLAKKLRVQHEASESEV